MSTDLDSPIFICGHDRSGTTMMRMVVIRAGVAIPKPSMHLIDFEPVRRGAMDLSDRRTAQRFVSMVWSHPKLSTWRLHVDEPTVPDGLTHDEAYRFAVESPYRAWMAEHGGVRWGDKTAPYVEHLDDILAVWPAARIIVMVRDGRDVTMSLMKVPFGANNALTAARSWVRCIKAGRSAAERHPANVREFRYEDVVSDPRTVIPQVFEFAGLEFDEAVLDVQETDAGMLESDKLSWFTQLWNGINTGSMGRWRREMSPRGVRVFESIAAEELARYGYEVVNGDALAQPGAVARAGMLTHDAALKIRNFVRLRLFQERGRDVRLVFARKWGGLVRRVKPARSAAPGHDTART